MSLFIISVLLALVFLVLVSIKTSDVFLSLGLVFSAFAAGYYFYDLLENDRDKYTTIELRIPKKDSLDNLLKTAPVPSFKFPSEMPWPNRNKNDA